MNLAHQMNEWSLRHHPKWLVVLRVGLGLCLFIQGFEFIRDSVVLPGIISQTPLIKNAPWLSSFIPWMHILGGSFLLVGLFTRFWALLQIPFLVGAVFLVNMRHGINPSELLFSIIILMLLVFFFIEGGGRLSLDNYFANYKRINKEN